VARRRDSGAAPSKTEREHPRRAGDQCGISPRRQLLTWRRGGLL
jgi:hypothetical protein